jgi:eukaryotic-like serine/threonine-protein kinase
MSLVPGTRVGAYEILTPLGAGGMGEVYKARDTRLDRVVAIKVLAAHAAGDPAFRERFDREARTISQLNHTQICTLHDVGEENGAPYLVLEYLEGETLADRLTRGALTIESALAVGIQICAGLDQAHRHGIVHRDLKPGNVMLIGKGTVPQVKLLDFGLAKSTAPLAAGGAGAVTVSTPMTVPGVLLGTLPYMSPEQAEGRDADARSDIFAFGAVLYEMVSGRRAFEGRSAASVLAAVLDRDPPPLASLQALSPPALDHIVARCLAKDPDERWQSAGDVMRELRWVASAPPPAAIGAVRRGWSVAWVASTIALAAALAGTAAWTARKTPDRREPVQFSILPPSGTRWSSQASISISPDGRHLAFVAWVGSIEARRLWIHSFGTGESRELAGTEGATRPFWSPDSQHIAFFAGDGTVAGGWELKRIG